MTTDVRVPLMLVGLLGAVVAIRVAAWPIARIRLPPSRTYNSSAQTAGLETRIASESAAAIVSRDPFRIGRQQALPAYDPLRLAEQLAPPPPRPTLVLLGVVNGIDPSAVIEGLPGVEGSRVVRVGDVVAGLQIKKIAGGRVMLAGLDTTWVLEVREPWKP